MNVVDLIKSEGGANIALTINANDLRNVVTDIVRDERERAAKEAVEQNELAAITREEAAKMLNVSLTTLWRWNQEGYLKIIKVGYKALYRKSDIEAMLRQSQTGDKL